MIEAIEIPDDSSDGPKPHDEDICELEHLRKLFIGGLAPYTTEESLKEFYGQWGTVVDSVVMRDPTTKRSRGFGFITFAKACSVDEAQKNRPHIIDGKNVDPKRALPRPEREGRDSNITVKKLFVGGLKDNHDEECLEEYFTKFGNVVSVKILTDKTTGKRRGFAFIEYDDYDSVDKAILQKVHTIKYVVVDVKKSVYKQEKQREANEMNNDDKNNQNKVGQKPTQVGPQPPNYRSHVPQPPMHPYQQGPPMPYPQGPPYNYWGPPMAPQYGPYQPPPQMNGWNAPTGWNPPNGWNAGPPQACAPPGSWYPNQWYPNAPMPGQQPTIGAPPPPNWNAPPAVPPTNGPPQQQQGPPVNFGTGYQQNYGGGPTKHNSTNTNRIHPYGPSQNATYASGNQQAPPQGYNGYGQNKPTAAAAPAGKTGAQTGAPSNNTSTPVANKFRR